MERAKYALAVAGRVSFIVFLTIVFFAALFKAQVFGTYNILAAILCWSIGIASFFLRCGRCRRSFYFDEDAYRGGFSPMPGAAHLKPISRCCRNCGYDRFS
jgi:hypothetical protein